MQFFHAITKTESGYTLKVWEPAEITQDRVRPCLWEINIEAATTDTLGIVLKQLDLLHRYQSENLELVPLPVSLPIQDLTAMDWSKSQYEVIRSNECTTQSLGNQHK